MVLIQNFQQHRQVLPYKSIHNIRDIFYDEMVLIFVLQSLM